MRSTIIIDLFRQCEVRKCARETFKYTFSLFRAHTGNVGPLSLPDSPISLYLLYIFEFLHSEGNAAVPFSLIGPHAHINSI